MSGAEGVGIDWTVSLEDAAWRSKGKVALQALARRTAGARLGELTYKPNRILRGPARLEVLLP